MVLFAVVHTHVHSLLYTHACERVVGLGNYQKEQVLILVKRTSETEFQQLSYVKK